MHSFTPILRRLCLGLAALAMLGATPGDPVALKQPQLGTDTNTPACCQLTTSLIQDVLRGKDASGDERFFSAEGAPPNIHFVIDTSGSMRELPQLTNSDHASFFEATAYDWPDVKFGCSNPWLQAYSDSKGWDKNKPYPIPDPGTQIGSDTGYTNLFQDNRYYGYGTWGDLSNPPVTWNTKEAACAQQVPGGTGNTVEYSACLLCLQEKGYFKTSQANPGATSRDFILWGRFLNFNPPKYVSAKAVLKQVIKDLKRVRAGFSVFSSSGSSMKQPMNPSCDQIAKDSAAWDNNRASYIASINSLTFTQSTPLARSLLNAGYYFTSHKGVYEDSTAPNFGFGSGSNTSTYYQYPTDFRNAELNSQNRSVCWGCQVSSIIIVTDGEPTADQLPSSVVNRLRVLNGGPVYCPTSRPCSGKQATPPFADNYPDKGPNETDWADDHPFYMLDDVAKLLHTRDLQHTDPPIVKEFNTAGVQNLNIYTVGFGINSNLLKNTAVVGGGEYYTADDGESLKTALLEIIKNVVTRSTSFSAPAASTLQIRSAGGTVIPRFKPSKNTDSPWQGFLYRFDIAAEQILGCTSSDLTMDLNQDGDCNDTHIIDKHQRAVLENDLGDFVLLRTPTEPAVPFWEASNVLKPQPLPSEEVDPDDQTNPYNTTQYWKTRKIYTIIDTNRDGRIDRMDAPVEFTEENSELLREYLGISNNSAECEDLRVKLNEASLTPDECTKLVIRYYRGANVLDDPWKRDYDRPNLLSDIFHSSPISVEPPAPRAFCTFFPQCTQTLFRGKTLQQTGYTFGQKEGLDAYDMYFNQAGQRDKIVLVGSNGGMLHAFHNGTFLAKDNATQLVTHDAGTGKELWAFIPPDLLPKLRPNLGKHAYFIDGSPMVREVWMDGIGQAGDAKRDGKKQWSEYRTVAIVGSGRGGVHRFALDLTDLLASNMSDNPPQPRAMKADGTLTDDGVDGVFLWTWPQPCDPLALQVGESFTNFSPLPPPIGPVALTPTADDELHEIAQVDDDGNIESPWTFANPNNEPATPARERWVVMFNGGYDQYLTRGRGVAMVDILSGHTVWSFFHDDGKPRSEHMRYPVAAGITMQDIGEAKTNFQDADLLLDTATVGDLGGQLWLMRFWRPGEWDASKQQVSNWLAARGFVVDKTAGWSDPNALRAPFSYMATNTIQPGTGYMRTFIGTGDNQNILDKGSVCRLSNPQACAAQGCAVSNTITVKRGDTLVWSSTAQFANYQQTSADNTEPPYPTANACAGLDAKVEWSYTKANGCENDKTGSIQYACSGDTDSWSCTSTSGWETLKLEKAEKPYARKFYGVWTYGGADPLRRFDTEEMAQAYDAKTLTDFTEAQLTEVGQFNSDTTSTTEGQVSTTQQEAPPQGKGWKITYAQTNERTGNSGSLVNGCMIWGSFEPSGAAGAVCSTTGTNVSRLYQANFATGKADCALGFYSDTTDKWSRYIKYNTVATAPAPRPQLTMVNGQMTLTMPLLGSGVTRDGTGDQSVQAPEIDSSDSAVKSFYQIELDRRGHDCRHEGNQAACDGI